MSWTLPYYIYKCDLMLFLLSYQASYLHILLLEQSFRPSFICILSLANVICLQNPDGDRPQHQPTSININIISVDKLLMLFFGHLTPYNTLGDCSDLIAHVKGVLLTIINQSLTPGHPRSRDNQFRFPRNTFRPDAQLKYGLVASAIINLQKSEALYSYLYFPIEMWP